MADDSVAVANDAVALQMLRARQAIERFRSMPAGAVQPPDSPAAGGGADGVGGGETPRSPASPARRPNGRRGRSSTWQGSPVGRTSSEPGARKQGSSWGAVRSLGKRPVTPQDDDEATAAAAEPEPEPEHPAAAELVGIGGAAVTSEAGRELERLKAQLAEREAAAAAASQRNGDGDDAAEGPSAGSGARRGGVGSRLRALKSRLTPSKGKNPGKKQGSSSASSAAASASSSSSSSSSRLIVRGSRLRDLLEVDVPEREQWGPPPERRYRRLWRWGELSLATLFLLLVLVLGTCMLGVSLCQWVLGLLMGWVMQGGGVRLLVNTLYTSRLGVVRELALQRCLRCTRRCRTHDAHSQELRVDVPLPPLRPRLGAAAGGGGNDNDDPPPRFCSVHSIALMLDNYCYLLVDRSSGRRPFPAALVDPADPGVAMAEMHRIDVEHYGGNPDRFSAKGRGLQLVALLVTHKHWDHAAGNRKLKEHWVRHCACVDQMFAAQVAHHLCFAAAYCQALMPDVLETKPSVELRIYGGVHDDVWCCTHPMEEGDLARVGSLQLTVIHTPCHTVRRYIPPTVIGPPTPSLRPRQLLQYSGSKLPTSLPA
jgi:glyoxylase-like metal-dependent hydrolase (beta-lactamase superfamily II)